MDLICSIYYNFPSLGGKTYFDRILNKVLELIFKRILDLVVPHYFANNSVNTPLGINTLKRDKHFVVSLTTFPARIELVWITVECLLRQTYKPDEIVIWLSNDQFSGLDTLPQSLLTLQQRGLKIMFCDGDMKAHKKYLYTFSIFPDSYIITVDDDLYYDKRLVERVVKLHNSYPDNISANRAHRMTIKNEEVAPYKEWIKRISFREPSHLNFSTGGGGTLYPPNVLDLKSYDENLIKNLCYNADDVWLKVMSILSQRKVVTNKYYTRNFIAVGKTQNDKLVNHNVHEGGNDIQLKSLIDFFSIDISQLE